MFGFEVYPEHQYSLTVLGLKKSYDKMFSTRQSANDYMYKLCAKFGLHVEEIWDDKHDKTYICSGRDVRFFIHRCY